MREASDPTDETGAGAFFGVNEGEDAGCLLVTVVLERAVAVEADRFMPLTAEVAGLLAEEDEETSGTESTPGVGATMELPGAEMEKSPADGLELRGALISKSPGLEESFGFTGAVLGVDALEEIVDARLGAATPGGFLTTTGAALVPSLLEDDGGTIVEAEADLETVLLPTVDEAAELRLVVSLGAVEVTTGAIFSEAFNVAELDELRLTPGLEEGATPTVSTLHPL